ncbi:DNA adenine methylase [Paenilisteria rocourtiae]|uniref:site-specific DNA-methyltransferase (adenine-specific) n=1 Tax=Listeria rocourtiae TaxID=647910 RepID=A0A4R6ZLH9_9LIST|nr:DNA adenine methylase [Listeria rocourtiae]TDR53175.1 site-specific DNA-adenine methylase [Listeria rocourtiae]
MAVTKSPLRYPGGKTQLSNFVSNLIEINKIEECIYIEPFSGGAGVAIELLLTGKVESIVLNDYDKAIHSIWYSILNHTSELINLIRTTPITIGSWYEQKMIHENTKQFQNSLENGFSTLFLNRTNRSGIINAGPIGGYDQKGNYKIDCRFNKKAIIKKIEDIASRKNQIYLYRKDTVELINIIKEDYDCNNSFIFFDPPYYVQGNKLYTNFYKDSNHKSLGQGIATLNDYYWITTYDYAPQIYEIYTQWEGIQSFEYKLQYSAQTKRRAAEYLFASEKTIIDSHDRVKLLQI